MDFKLSDEEKLIRDTAAQFVRREMLTRERDYLRQEELFLAPGDPPRRELDAEVYASLQTIARRIGLWALELPPAGDGVVMSAVGRVLVYREFGRTILPFEPASIPALMAVTSYASELTAGKISLSLAFDQMHRTGTLDGVTTGYRRVSDGFLLSDTRVVILDDPEADLFLLPARREGSDETGLFLIAADAPGASIEARQDLTTDTVAAELSLKLCAVGKDQLLGGKAEIEAIVASQQLRIAARCLGVAMRCLADTIEHARNRVTFDRPLAQRQAVQWMLADLSTDISTSTWLTLESAWRADNDMPYFQEAVLAKKRAAKTAFQAADTAIQIHGGYGVCKEFPFEGFYREARLLRLIYGREAEMDRARGERFLRQRHEA
jgi:alkylation response protein AidB-like acyl-CoA dehydrogenase